ncbi:MAG: cytochrome bc complex cytochrome b subunit [Oscillatoriales cyanobacterium RM1_1_9]|nr:cytochrome bc complex cytochrome b subunit [Oscillatoriales cyanobacterium SM2_3_0]NJO47670.1 cytochrome bc complex cytochrome b subunit [Oscillatoriales cyanobacterium RM2_1_1]NJO71165.1 cytochrome bc complex cytochrome b subunit [Oscillatoriales cyanobacterium RM1_1_9]
MASGLSPNQPRQPHQPGWNFILRRAATIIAVAILTLTLLAGLSGLLLAFNYQPAAGRSYQSLKYIDTATNFGWLFRSLHTYTGNFVIVLGLIQLVVMFLGRQFRRSWLGAWISGIFLILVAIALDWTAILLSWTQEGFWRFSIELGTIEAIPVVGSTLRSILTGGEGISTATVLRQYTLHSYVLSGLVVVLAIIHLVSTLIQDRQERSLQAQQAISATPESTQNTSSEQPI